MGKSKRTRIKTSYMMVWLPLIDQKISDCKILACLSFLTYQIQDHKMLKHIYITIKIYINLANNKGV